MKVRKLLVAAVFGIFAMVSCEKGNSEQVAGDGDISLQKGGELLKLSDFESLEGTLEAVPPTYDLTYPNSDASTVMLYTDPGGWITEVYAFDNLEDLEDMAAEAECDQDAWVSGSGDNKTLHCDNNGNQCTVNEDCSITLCEDA